MEVCVLEGGYTRGTVEEEVGGELVETKVYVLEGCHTRGTVEEVGGTGRDGGMCIRRGSH